MKSLIFTILITLLAASGAFPALDGPTVEAPADCEVCGMSRTLFARSRSIVTYADGTSAGLCSIHCAAATLKERGNGKVNALQVADYRTKELIRAESAVWVVGGSVPGVMTSQPKWAFADRADALEFVRQNNGAITPFDDVLKLSRAEVSDASSATESHGNHHRHASQLLTNPAFGDDIYHTHPAGMWMVNYKYQHTALDRLRDGTSNVGVKQVIPMNNSRYGYMMTPTGMTMDMHMVMLMYGVTDRFTLMGMAGYQDNRMEMLMNMGGMMGVNRAEPPMKTSGIGDTELRGVFRISDELSGSLGVSIPTGSINQEFTTMGMRFRVPYDMQLGSGTVDLKPAITYNALSDDGSWNWGGQASYSHHIDRNDNHYALGDSLKLTGWLQRALGPFASWLRLAYSNSARISGEDPEIKKLLDPMMGAPTPDADPRNYGGDRIDGFAGISLAQGPLSIGIEAGLPLYQNLNGLQLKSDWYLNAGIQAMF